MNDNETIADIIAEKRRDAQHIRNNLSTVPVRRLDQLAEIKSLADEADRIEAAHKREIEATAAKCCQLGRLAGYGASEIKHQQEPVGNAAKLREALVRFYEWAILDLNENAWMGDSSGNYKKLLDAMAKGIAAALAAPPRNCDRFASAEEAWDAYDEWADSYRAQGKTEPFNEVGWLFATATEKKGESDGSK